ncbi:MAG: ATP-dependent Clp protease ATP-binding subunit [Myxococcales bacterium]|nr:ATP-dependent Clp protease ATP-binding subunit [Myxococcales bacterium]MCB9580265.1 ATP-dependent Clp protease ATP-binding subunit [Polyangiaceae bacterium]
MADERDSVSLAQQVARQPLSLVLLDEIEKAHAAVFDLLLGVLGEGRLTTAGGRRVDMRMTLIVMTSNLGTSGTLAGFGAEGRADGAEVRAVRDHFRPELFNRIDRVVPFTSLSSESLLRIVDLELAEIGAREGFGQRNIRLDVTAEAKAKLAELGHSPKYGARPLERVLEERVMAPVAVELARRPKLRNAVARVTLEGDDVRVTFGAGA